MNTSKFVQRYTGAVEFRLSNNGIFKFNTIKEIESKYLTVFQSYGSIDISFCNYLNNTSKGNIDNNPPCLICLQKYLSNITNCIFIRNEYMILARIVATSSKTSGNILMINCYSDKYKLKEKNEIIQIDCNLNYGDGLKINSFSYLDLGPCLGDVEVPDFFSPSSEFTKSQIFSMSKRFSISDEFSNSNQFSKTKEFHRYR